jgi:hypothetical protein
MTKRSHKRSGSTKNTLCFLWLKNLDAKPRRDILPQSQIESCVPAFAVIPGRSFQRRLGKRLRTQFSRLR